MDTKKKILIAVLAIIIIISLGVIGAAIKVLWPKNNVPLKEDTLGVQDIVESGEESGEVEPVVEEPPYTGPEIFSGDARPIAIMIDNEKGAWPQAGLNDAYMIYEITVEGGESRFIAFFKGKDTTRVGPVRSSRHYFLDYVLEHDAIYVHFGWSPLAQSDIPRLGINNINGIYDTFFWREAPLNSYHNAFTSMENILKYATRKGYRQTSSKECVLDFYHKDTELKSGDTAHDIYIPYSTLQNTSYQYDSERKVYLRSMRGIEHRDRWTDEQFYAKNIVILFVTNTLLNDPENKGRQELYNTGTGNGYFITNGKYIPIIWKKDSRSDKTVYYDEDGEKVLFNDGITWVQIVPKNAKVTIE